MFIIDLFCCIFFIWKIRLLSWCCKNLSCSHSHF